MTLHFIREIEKIKTRILSLSAYVEESVVMAVKSLTNRDGDMAREVIHRDRKIDEAEVELEEECLKLLALYQPVAQDLRFLIAILKINNDLERIGDQAVNIAYRADTFAQYQGIEIPETVQIMADNAENMLSDGLDALINLDVKKAQKVCLSDDVVDNMHHEIYSMVSTEVVKHPDQFGILFKFTEISHQLERIADLATNIAEEVIYMVEGRITRHQGKKSNGDAAGM
ncbi:phosphate signaling complex protein PhoU [bacterium]|nr:phosphate signaling complex protein PhoU [candidate division CSSED10-310 bacterium]